MKEISNRYSLMDDAVFTLVRGNILSKVRGQVLHKRVTALWEAELRAAFRESRPAPQPRNGLSNGDFSAQQGKKAQ